MENKIKNNRKRSLLLIGFILFLIISITGSTYAYLAFSASNNSVVVGEIGVPNLELNVSKVTPISNNGDLVPQLEKSLDTAVSSNHNCVDGNGNVVCHVYKIDIENTGTAKIVVDGTIDFTNTSLPNLKYKLMTDSTTLDTSFNSRYGYGDMEDRPMVKGLSLEPEQVETYYIVFWVNDTESEQPDTGTYIANINFNSSYMEGLTSTYVNYLVSFSEENDIAYFHSDTYREKIKNISFVNYINTSNAVASWDMGTLQNGGIMAWVENNATSGYYDLYIGSTEVIKGQDMSYYFKGMTNVDNISFNNLDTSEVIDMQGMFSAAGSMSSIFTLDLGDNFNTSNVKNMERMFSGVARNSSQCELHLGDDFDTSNVENMTGMFEYFCMSCGNVTINLDDKFDTSNVTRMDSMFDSLGRNSYNIVIELGDKFDTNNVESVFAMFYEFGFSANYFELDFTTFTFDNIVEYSSMLDGIGKNGKIYVKNDNDRIWLLNRTDLGSVNEGMVIVR